MTKMRVMQVSRANGPFEYIEREIPAPDGGQVRIKVEACGICHSDSLVKDGLMPGLQYPRIPGHEVAGIVDAVGAGVKGWDIGKRVAVGWNGGYCGHCESCRRGNLFACAWGAVTGLTHDGGYAEYMIAHSSSLALIPEKLSATEAGPLVCAGITMFNSLRNSGARPGDTVAILGLGGLGHLGVQFAAKMGFRTIAIARGADKEGFARELGAHHYIDSRTQDVAAELTRLGGASVVFATVTDGPSMTNTIGGLGIHGKLLVIGVPHEPLSVPVLPLIQGRRSVAGWYSGTSIDSEDTLNFSAMTGVRAMTEVYPLEKAAEAYERMISGNARFRVVLTTGR